jgi:PPOX class probable F420-dependent enzyme
MSADVLPDQNTEFGRRVRNRLTRESVIWFTTVGRDGTPQPNPVWFTWNGGEVLVYSMSDAHRLLHIRDHPNVSLSFDGDALGDDVVVIRGRAEVADDLPPAHEHPDYLAKYRDDMIRVSGSPEAFSRVYSVPVRIHIDHVRGY